MPALNDPTSSSRPEISRGGFIGVGAAAAAGSLGLAQQARATEVFGQPHPPIVPEDDPAIEADQVALTRPDATIGAYAATPRGAARTTPGVVVVQHIWGVDAQIRDTVRRFAKAGYGAIAPDLYARQNPPSGDNATDYTPFRALAQKLDQDQVRADLAAGAAWLRERVGASADARPPKVGIIGFCMGGGIALSAAARTPAYDALAMFYGSPNDEYAAKLKIPLVGSFGARDSSIPVDKVRGFQTHLTVPTDIKIYEEAGHAFFDDTRQSYVASAATDAWSRTLTWFAKYLTALM